MNKQWKSVQHMQEGTCFLLVTHEVSKRIYFDDMDKTGWVLMEGKLYEVRDHYVDETGASINERVVDLNAPLGFDPDTTTAIVGECIAQKNMPFFYHFKGIMEKAEKTA